jgi:hypothetical protein
VAVTVANENDFQVTKTGNAITITKYVGKGTVVNIPARIQNLPVTSIGEDAFLSNNSITSVAIPNGVTSIGVGAFQDCTKLTSVVIPEGVKTIGEYAFANTGLTSVAIPNSVTSIGGVAFGSTKLTSVTIPASVTSIGSGAFAKCTSLTSITIQGQGKFDLHPNTVEGNLRTVWNGVAGTYTRPNGTSTTWTKK